MSGPKVDRFSRRLPKVDRTRQQWDRQEREGSEAYRAFCVYRESDVGERSYDRVAQQIRCAIQLVKRWALFTSG